MITTSRLKNSITLYIRAQNAESGPPLGTVLGNLGLNAVKFCKDFNDFTKDLPNYFVLTVKIFVYNDRSFSFLVGEPSLNNLLSLLIKEDKDNQNFYVMCDDIIKLAMFKFSSLPLNLGFSIVYSNVKLRNLKIYV